MAEMTGNLLGFCATLIFCVYFPETVIANKVETAGGVDCVFPYIYQGKKYYACITANHNRPWCALTNNYDADGDWGNCISEDVATTGGTADGAKCYFPFKFLGGDKYECTMDYHNQLWCGTTRNYDQDKKWGNCGATAMRTTEGNSYGAPCCFPFLYNGVEFDGCTSFDSRYRKAWCGTTPDYDKDEQWGYCMVKTYGGNSFGANCNFPFYYKGKEYGRCIVTPANGRFEPWCATTYNHDADGKYGNCIMKSTLKCEASGSVTELPGVTTTLPPNSTTTIRTSSQKSCVYSPPFVDTNARGGTPSPGASTVEDCIRQCDAAPTCVALDFDMNDEAPSRCWHHFNPENLNPENVGNAAGVDHYRKLPGCHDDEVDTCTFTRRDNTNAFGGVDQGSATTPQQCRTLCARNPTCVAYEWETNPNPNTQIRCFTHTDRDRVENRSIFSEGKTTTQFVKDPGSC